MLKRRCNFAHASSPKLYALCIVLSQAFPLCCVETICYHSNPIVQEVIETVKKSLGTELEFNISVMLDGREVRLVMESV